MEEKDTYRNIEIAERAVHDIGFRMSEEFVAWMQDEQHRTLFHDLMLFREAMMNMDKSRRPNVKKALRRVVPKADRKRMRAETRRMMRLWVAVSILFLLVLLVILFIAFRADVRDDQSIVTVVPAVAAPSGVTLSIDDSGKIELNDACQVLADEGVLLSDSGLSYRQDKAEKVAYHILSVPRGQNFRLDLEDGTTVWLNAESRLTYPNRFTGKERRVSVDGEAYFRVAKDAARPFVVNASGVETQTLDSDFNVRAYVGEVKHVTLIRGNARVSDVNRNFVRTLSPGQDAEINEARRTIHVDDVDVKEYTAWRDNRFYFQSKELIEIMQKIGRWYNMEIVFSNRKSMHYHFSFWIDKNASLDEMLKILNEVGKVKIEKADGRLIIH